MQTLEYDQLSHSDPKVSDIFVVDWCVSSVCNYSCSYCPEDLHDHKRKFPDAEVVINFCSRVMEHYSDKRVYFQFTGGEVSLWKEFPQVLRAIKNHNGLVGLISNGSRALNWWDKNIDLIDHACLSFHPEYAKADHFVECAQFISERTTAHCNVMMSPPLFDKAMALADRLYEIDYVSVALQPLLKDFKDLDENYTPEQLATISNQCQRPATAKHNPNQFRFRSELKLLKDGNEVTEMPSHVLISNNMNHWKGWACAIGKEQIVVDLYGNVARGWCFVGGPLGTIYDEELSFPKSGIICNRDFCHCNLDIMSSKKKVEILEPSLTDAPTGIPVEAPLS